MFDMSSPPKIKIKKLDQKTQFQSVIDQIFIYCIFLTPLDFMLDTKVVYSFCSKRCLIIFIIMKINIHYNIILIYREVNMRQSAQRKKISILSERLTRLMEEKNLNLTTLALKADIAVGTVQKMISDPQCNPTINSVEAISNALDVPISFLIGQEKSNCCSEISIPKFSWETLSNDLSKSKYSMQGSKTTKFSLEVTENLKTLIFPIGSLLIFDKQKPYNNGAYVLVYFNETKQYLLKRLIIDEPNLYISSIHLELTRSEPIPIRKKQIIATLTQIRL